MFYICNFGSVADIPPKNNKRVLGEYMEVKGFRKLDLEDVDVIELLLWAFKKH